ncbi:MAG: 6-hydroxymethylpterin diphosphokinase MptE-like protein [Candidatus Thorarchaeota archaeon]
MQYSDWKKYYQKVVNELGISEKSDLEAASNYLGIINNFENAEEKISLSIKKIKKVLGNDKIIIFGAGPNLVTDLKKFVKNFTQPFSGTIIAADGATQCLAEFNIKPNIIVTDYDSDLIYIQKFGKEGSILILHGHGDNIALLKNWFPKLSLSPFWIPTIQTEPIFPFLYNFGGFTDGDRALSLALHFSQPCEIYLAGFDFGKIVGKYSKPYLSEDSLASEFKQKKLKFAQYFISELQKKWYPSHTILYFYDIKKSI